VQHAVYSQPLIINVCCRFAGTGRPAARKGCKISVLGDGPRPLVNFSMAIGKRKSAGPAMISRRAIAPPAVVRAVTAKETEKSVVDAGGRFLGENEQVRGVRQ